MCAPHAEELFVRLVTPAGACVGSYTRSCAGNVRASRAVRTHHPASQPQTHELVARREQLTGTKGGLMGWGLDRGWGK